MILFNEEQIQEQISTSNLLREDGNENLLSFSNDQGTLKSKPTFVDKAVDFVSGIPEAVGVGIPKGIPVGASKFGIELMDTFTNGAYSKNFLPWLNENVPGLEELNHAINKVLKPEGTAQKWGSMFGDVTGQIIVPGALFTKAGQALNVGSKFLTNVLGYGTAEVVGINPKDNGLLELGIGLMVKNDELKKAMLESFKADEDASVFMQKLQKAPQRFFEGGIIGEGISKAIEGVGTLYRYAKDSKTLEKIGNKAQQELDLQGGSTTLSSMGGGEIEKGINKQLAKLGSNNKVDDFVETNIAKYEPNYKEELNKIALARNPNAKNPKLIVEDIHKFYDQLAIKKYGRKLKLSNPDDYNIILNENVDAIKYQLTKEVSGKGWYDSDVLKTFNMLSRMPGFEKLGTNENHRVILSAILGATSPGPKVAQNTKAGVAQYLKWVRTGKFSTKAPPPGTSVEKIQTAGFGQYGYPKGLKMLQFLLDKFGEDKFADFMLSPHTKGELTKLRKEAGFTTGPSGMSGTADSLHLGMRILGDKAGAFALNINGYPATTKDKWFVRTIRRSEGTFGDHLVKNINKKTGTEKMVELGQPQNQSERLLMDQLVKDLIAHPSLKNLKLSEQDAQAILWFREQNLQSDLGVATKPETFSEGVENVSGQKGFGIRTSDADKIKIEQGTIEPKGYRDISSRQRAVRSSRRKFQRINDSGGSGGVSRTYEGRGSKNAGGDGGLTFEINPEIKARYLKSGINSPVITQVNAKTSAKQYSQDMADAMANHVFGKQVTIQNPKDLLNSKLYRTEYGGGFVIKPDGDIVGVFNKPGSPEGSVYPMIQLAVEQGGKKLDAFNTFLPKIYETVGFKPVSRVKWSDKFAPDGWSKEAFKKFNNGEPDLILYVYDPKYFGGVNKNDLPIFDGDDGYLQAQKIQQTELNKLDQGGTDGST